ncbi:MFS transporter [Chitinophaga pendula]|nr:MFS transporter [Chitinophaga pendula]UCJ08559.1 MFS transporter [Chitinophaga pendula]
MKLTPSSELSPDQVQSGLRLVVKDGLATEAMVVLTAGAFLTAIALQMGASNFQIGVLAAMPTFTNIFQLFSIWLVHRYRNRRAITVICSTMARLPLVCIGLLPWILPAGATLPLLMSLLSFHYFFGSIAGASWNSWMKDLIPGQILGSYFSRRTRLAQSLNVTLSISIALLVDYLKERFPGNEISIYTSMFLLAGIAGLLGVYALSRVQEPRMASGETESLLRQIRQPLKDTNYRRMLLFNASWVFALNLATPFFMVYMMKTLRLPISTIILLGILAQLSSICFVSVWGKYIDKYSNKNVIRICAPVYIACLLAWAFTALYPAPSFAITLLALINIATGMATSGITLALNNIGIKLAPQGQAMVYLSAKNMLNAFTAALAPLFGGLMADYFVGRQVLWNVQWHSASRVIQVPLLHLQQWNFFFVISAILAMIAIRLLRRVAEPGEVESAVMTSDMNSQLKRILKEKPARQVVQRIIYRPSKWKHPSQKKDLIS